jgi:hypothetical protein
VKYPWMGAELFSSHGILYYLVSFIGSLVHFIGFIESHCIDYHSFSMLHMVLFLSFSFSIAIYVFICVLTNV